MTSQTSVSNSPWSVLQGVPFYTISPLGKSSTGIVNNGADFGPDTESTQTSGLLEFFLTLPSANVPFQDTAYAGYMLPGAFECKIPLVIPNCTPVLVGSGKETTSIKCDYTPSGVSTFVSATNTASTIGLSDGSYFGHFSIDYNSQAFDYGFALGNPGGNSPDAAAIAMLLENINFGKGNGNIVTTEVVMSSIEDTLLFQCATGNNQNIEWITNNGSAKMIGGNMDIVEIPSVQFSVVDCVNEYFVIGNSKARSAINVVGIGGNGNDQSPYVYVNSGAGKDLALTTKGVTYSMASGTSNGTGFIGGPGVNVVVLTSEGDRFTSNSTTQALFASGAAAWAKIDGAVVTDQTISNFLGTGSFINGTIIDDTNVMFNVLNGFVRPVGLISSPFGKLAQYNNGGTYSSIGPGVSSSSANPSANVVYSNVNSPIQVLSSGGSNVSITIEDRLGNTIVSGLSTLSYPGAYLYPGPSGASYTINFGNFSSAPTVLVYGL